MADQNHAERYMQMCDTLDSIARRDWAGLPTMRLLQARAPEVDMGIKKNFFRYWLGHTMKLNKGRLVVTDLEALDLETRTGATHRVLCHRGEARRELPRDLKGLMQQEGWRGASKVEVSWVSAYCARIFPDRTVPGWEQMELSHRCVEYGLAVYGAGRPVGEGGAYQSCIDARCLVWEPKAVNQSRGHAGGCTSRCHCGCNSIVCGLYGIHVPTCL